MDQQTREETTASSLDAAFSCLADGDRRRLLRHLSESAPGTVSREDATDVLAAHVHGKPVEAVSEDERDRVATAVHHSHLPALADAGLVELDEHEDTVRLTDHPALRDSGVVDAIQGAAATGAFLDGLFDALAKGRRRTILDVLSHQFGPVRVETLARELEADGRDVTESDVETAAVERTMVGLQHVDLPRLSDAGLIEYDTDDQTVAYAGHPDLTVPWTHSVFEPEFRASLTGETDPGGIGELEGRERVISFGQSLCDRADEELFCMFTDAGLLENGCLTRLRDAAQERDVDVYLGTCDPVIREYVEENAPEVTLWEPSTDWLNLPVADDRVGRLLMADREAVMLGTLLGERTDDVQEEQAIVGESDSNTLVTMVRQLLGPRLDDIDTGAAPIEPGLSL